MPDKSRELVLDALQRAAATSNGLPLHGSRTAAGLFSASQSGKQAGQRCLQEGLLRVRSVGNNGKSPHDVCTITEKGLEFLLDEVKPARILEQLIETLRAQQVHLHELATSSKHIEDTIGALKHVAEQVLQRIPVGVNSSSTWEKSLLATLARWHAERNSDDCPLPELFRQTHQSYAALTPGQFHDALRQYHEQGRIYLHPWTGPLYDLPEPTFALLAGHEIVYYASLRS